MSLVQLRLRTRMNSLSSPSMTATFGFVGESDAAFFRTQPSLIRTVGGEDAMVEAARKSKGLLQVGFQRHIPHVTHPDLYTDRITAFIRRHEGIS